MIITHRESVTGEIKDRNQIADVAYLSREFFMIVEMNLVLVGMGVVIHDNILRSGRIGRVSREIVQIRKLCKNAEEDEKSEARKNESGISFPESVHY